MNLRENLELYHSGKRMRKDMYGVFTDAIEELQGRIGAVDEEAVNDLRERVAALELIIGNALKLRAVETVSGYTPLGEMDTLVKRKPGRPRKEAA